MQQHAVPDMNTPWAASGVDQVMPAIIETSHQRSMAYGLSPGAAPDCYPLDKSSLSYLIEQNHLLHTHAVPAMETLYQQIVNIHNMVILTDANGVIVQSLGDDDFLEKANRVALKPGVAWPSAPQANVQKTSISWNSLIS